MGRNCIYTNVEVLEEKIDSYFLNCDNLEKVYSVSGLCLFLDITKKTLCNYEENVEFLHSIKKAKLRIEAQVEEFASMNKINPTIAIFNLKNNFGWKDKQEIESNNNNNNVNSGDVNINIRVVE